MESVRIKILQVYCEVLVPLSTIQYFLLRVEHLQYEFRL